MAAPLAPRIRTAQVIGTSGVRLDWDPSVGADSYGVLRADDSVDPDDLVPLDTVEETTFSDTTAATGHFYLYGVTAVAGVDESAPTTRKVNVRAYTDASDDSSFGRKLVVPLTNKSGGSVAAGDVVICDTTNDSAFTTTTTASDTDHVIGVALETIGSNAVGRVQIGGHVDLVNVTASVTRGHFGFTSTTVKKASGSSSRAAGAFCQFVTGGTSPAAVLWGFPDSSSAGGGAPSTAKYVTTAADGSLSAEIVIPGLGGSADKVAGGGSDDEFDTTDASDPMTGWTTLGAPTTHDMNTKALSHYYVKKSATGTLGTHGVYKASPSTPFTVTAKLTDATVRANNHGCGIFVGEASPGKMSSLYLAANTGGSTKVAITNALWTNPTTFGSTVTTIEVSQRTPLYLRIVATSTSNVAYYWSDSGIVWRLLASGHNPAFTIGSAGILIVQDNATYDLEAAFDWIRFS